VGTGPQSSYENSIGKAGSEIREQRTEIREQRTEIRDQRSEIRGRLLPWAGMITGLKECNGGSLHPGCGNRYILVRVRLPVLVVPIH